MVRAAVAVPVMRPAAPGTLTLLAGLLKFAWFGRLKNSTRNCKRRLPALPSDLTARQIDRMTWDARGLKTLWPLNAVGWKYGVRDYESGKRSFI